MCLARANSENIVVLTFYSLETNFILKTLQRLVKLKQKTVILLKRKLITNSVAAALTTGTTRRCLRKTLEDVMVRTISGNIEWISEETFVNIAQTQHIKFKFKLFSSSIKFSFRKGSANP